jgi:hypothetical protein
MEDARLLGVIPPPTKLSHRGYGDSLKDGDMKDCPALRSNNHGDVGRELCETSTTHSDASPGSTTTGRSTLEAVSPPTSGAADSFEVPETPSAIEQPRCPVDPSVVRVIGKRLDTNRPGYLVVCWVVSF